MDWLAPYLPLLGSVALAVVAVTILAQQRRSPQSAVAWVLFIILLPFVAVPLFLVLGFRKRDSRFADIAFARNPAAGAPVNTLDGLLRRYGIPPATPGNALALHADGREAHEALMALVAGAERRVDALVYLLADDAEGRAVVGALTEAARRGRAVRLVIDRLGSWGAPSGALEALRAAGGQVRFFSPFVRLPERGHMNLRNHRKMVIADDARVWAGGRNFGLDYMGPDGGRWEDLSFDLSGPAAETYVSVFESDWQATRGDPRPAPPHVAPVEGGEALAQLVPTGPDTGGDPLHDALVHAFHRAQRRIWVATPYYLPTDPLRQALSVAARRGVDVRLLVPLRSDQRVADLARGSFLRELDADGGHILRYDDRMLHAKFGIIDGIGYVGSANLDVRSMLLNFESALMCYDEGSAEALAERFRALMARSVPGIARTRWPRRVVESLFRIGAPVL